MRSQYWLGGGSRATCVEGRFGFSKQQVSVGFLRDVRCVDVVKDGLVANLATRCASHEAKIKYGVSANDLSTHMHPSC